MTGGHCGVGRADAGAKRIEPSVQLDPALVRLFHREGERIIEWPRRGAHPARKDFRPRLVGRSIEGVAARPNLQDDRIELEQHREIEQRQQFGFLLFGGEAGLRWPVDVLHCGHPEPAKFADWLRWLEVRRQIDRSGARGSATGDPERDLLEYLPDHWQKRLTTAVELNSSLGLIQRDSAPSTRRPPDAGKKARPGERVCHRTFNGALFCRGRGLGLGFRRGGFRRGGDRRLHPFQDGQLRRVAQARA